MCAVCSLAVAMLLLYYSFAIIGMELFARCQLKNCCMFVFLRFLVMICCIGKQVDKQPIVGWALRLVICLVKKSTQKSNW